METLDRDVVVKRAFQYRDALLAHAFAMLRDWSMAEDVVQDAYVVVMNRWADFQPGTAFFAWLRQIVQNKTLEALRSRGRKLSKAGGGLLDQVAAVLEEHLDEANADRQTLMRRALQLCMSSLNGRALAVLRGFYAGEETCETIARTQRRSANAIRLTLSRLRRQLHDCMSRQLPGLEGEA